MQLPDMSGVDAQSFDLVPVGEYVAVIRNASETTSKVKGTPGISVDFQIVGGAQANRYVWDTLWITQKALPRLRGCLETVGISIPAGAFNLDPASLIGKVVRIVVRHEQSGDYDPKAIVKAWKPADAAAREATATLPPTGTVPGAAMGDDYIPF